MLTPEGQHIRNVGKHGRRPGELYLPVSPAVHQGMVYVTEIRNHRISVFKTTGEFVTTFGEGIVNPAFMAIDKDGYIYVNSNCELIAIF